MLLALALSLAVTQAPPAAAKNAAPKPPAGPTAYDTAKLFYLAGDLAQAQEWARRGLKREPKTCGPLNALIAEYNSMVSRIDELTPTEAKTFLEIDRKISPTVRGKITEKAFTRYVVKPLELAKSNAAGDVPRALQLVDQVLFVDPKNPDALALKAQLAVDAGK